MARARVTGIGGVFLRARDVDRLSSWYAKHLDFELGTDEHGAAFGVFKWRELAPRRGKGMTLWALFPRSSDYFGRRGQPAMINFRVRDLAALRRQLRKEGVKVDRKVQRSPFGNFGWIYDPEGNKVELWEPPRPKKRRTTKKRSRARRRA